MTRPCELRRSNTHERRRKEKPQRPAFEAGNLPTSHKQSAFVRRDSGKKDQRHCLFALLKDTLLGERKLYQPFSLSFRKKEEMSLLLSRQMYHYTTNILPAVPPSQTKLNSLNTIARTPMCSLIKGRVQYVSIGTEFFMLYRSNNL